MTPESSYVNIEEYRNMVLQQLGEKIHVRQKEKKVAFEIDDIKQLYGAFVTLCNYMEEEVGCKNCPMHLKNCGIKGKNSSDVLERAMTRIREKTGVSDL